MVIKKNKSCKENTFQGPDKFICDVTGQWGSKVMEDMADMRLVS